MKQLIISIAIIICTAFSSYGRIVGTIVNGVPAVTLSSSDMTTQINSLTDYGFTSISLVEMHITYTAGAPASGFFFYTFTAIPPSSTESIKIIMSAQCSYDAGSNQFAAVVSGTGWACISKNCLECCPTANDCTACSVDDPQKSSSCERRVNDASWGADLECVLADIRSWLQS